jgi:uncharacterized membrane protein YphA (DoxX/SURF4 family)
MLYLGFISRILFAIVILTASLSKVRDAAAFAKTIRRLGITRSLAPAVAWLGILYEAALGILFTFGILSTISIVAALLLLILFAIVSIRSLILHEKIRCNCFGEASSFLGKQTLLRAILLFIPVSIYYLSTFFTNSAWWPTGLNTIIPLVSIAIAAILLTKWLLMARFLVSLVFERRQDEEKIAHTRAEKLPQNIEEVATP